MPLGVAVGPFSVASALRTAASVSAGSGEPMASSADCPASCSSHLNVEAGGLDHAPGGGGYFGANAVAGDEDDSVWHVNARLICWDFTC